MRQAKPFYCSQTHSYYVQLDGRQINLGPDEGEAYRRWHLLMAGVDESVVSAMNADKPEAMTEAVTVQQLTKRFRNTSDG